MADARACRTCSFFVGDEAGGECHRGPPTAVLAPSRNALGKPIAAPSSFFPPVTADSWCGEWVLTTKMAASAPIPGSITWTDEPNRRN